eukprot:15065610-Alexandrium_andersonii.AAC.1
MVVAGLGRPGAAPRGCPTEVPPGATGSLSACPDHLPLGSRARRCPPGSRIGGWWTGACDSAFLA